MVVSYKWPSVASATKMNFRSGDSKSLASYPLTTGYTTPSTEYATDEQVVASIVLPLQV